MDTVNLIPITKILTALKVQTLKLTIPYNHSNISQHLYFTDQKASLAIQIIVIDILIMTMLQIQTLKLTILKNNSNILQHIYFTDQKATSAIHIIVIDISIR